MVEDAGNWPLVAAESAIQLLAALLSLLLKLNTTDPCTAGLRALVVGHDSLDKDLGLGDGAESGHGGFDHHLFI